MTDPNLTREVIEKNPGAYLIIGDIDKPFHRPECECQHCELWRKDNDRPTHEELRKKLGYLKNGVGPATSD